jgi:hypothetical protein
MRQKSRGFCPKRERLVLFAALLVLLALALAA